MSEAVDAGSPGVSYQEVVDTDSRRHLAASERLHAEGSWVEGELKAADPHSCDCVGGPIVANHPINVDA